MHLFQSLGRSRSRPPHRATLTSAALPCYSRDKAFSSTPCPAQSCAPSKTHTDNALSVSALFCLKETFPMFAGTSRLPRMLTDLSLFAVFGLLALGPAANAQSYNAFNYSGVSFPAAGGALRYSGGAHPGGGGVYLTPAGPVGAVYDNAPVVLSHGFTTLITPDFGPNGKDTFHYPGGGQVNGVAFVVKSSTVAADSTAGGAGFSGLTHSVVVNFVPSYPNFNLFPFLLPPTKLGSIEVWTPQADGSLALLTDLGVNLPNHTALLVRYSPSLKALDIFAGTTLLLRVPNFDLGATGVLTSAPGQTDDGTAEVGIVSGRANSPLVAATLDGWALATDTEPVIGGGPNSADMVFPFSTTGQSLWGKDVHDVVAHQAFIKPYQFGGSEGTSISAFGKTVASIGVSAHGKGDAGIDFVEHASAGTVSLSYPLDLHVDFPAQYSVAPGGAVPLTLTYGPDPTALMTTVTPTANVQAYLDMNGSVGAGGNLYVYNPFGHDLNYGFGLNVTTSTTPDPSNFLYDNYWNNLSGHPNEMKIFDLYDILTSGLIPNVNGGQSLPGFPGNKETPAPGEQPETVSGSYQDKEGAEDSAHLDTSHERGGDKGSPLDYVQVSITIPNFGITSLAGSSVDPVGFDATAQQNILTLSSDITNDLIGLIPVVGDVITALPFVNNDYTSPSVAGYSVSAGVHILDLYTSLSLGGELAHQFRPKTEVFLELDDNNGHRSVQGPYQFVDGSGNDLTQIHVNDVYMPTSGSLRVTPILSLEKNTFKTTAYVTLNPTLTFDPADVDGGLNGSSFTFDSRKYTGAPYDLDQYFLDAINQVSGQHLTNPFVLPWGLPGTGNTFTVGEEAATNTNPDAVPFPIVTDIRSNIHLDSLRGAPIPILSSASLDPTLVKDNLVSLLTQKIKPTDTLPVDIQATNALSTAVVLLDHTTALVTNVEASNFVKVELPGTVDAQRGVHTFTLYNTKDSTGVLGAASNDLSFTVSAPAPKLDTLTAVDKAGKAAPLPFAGSEDFHLVASGQNFAPPVLNGNGSVLYRGTTVLWNGKPLPTTFGAGSGFPASSVTARVPAGLFADGGPVTITVETDGPGGGVSNSRHLVIDNPTPALDALSPQTVPLNGPTQVLRLNGTDFVPSTTVSAAMNGVSIPLVAQFLSPTRLEITLPAADLTLPGTMVLIAANPNLGGGSVHGSNSVPLRVVLPGVYLTPATTITRGTQSAQMVVALNNLSGRNATNVIVNSVLINGKPAASGPLAPSSLGNILVGGSASTGQTGTFQFAQQTGANALLTVTGTINGTPFTLRQRIALP